MRFLTDTDAQSEAQSRKLLFNAAVFQPLSFSSRHVRLRVVRAAMVMQLRLLQPSFLPETLAHPLEPRQDGGWWVLALSWFSRQPFPKKVSSKHF